MSLKITLSVAITAALLLSLTSQAAADRLTVEPDSATLVGPHERLQMVATEQESTGRPVDVTRSVTYRTLTPELVKVSPTGFVTPLRSGSAAIQVERGAATVSVSIEVSGMDGAAPGSFQKDVMPILSKAGCNQGACNASQYGKGGLKISLLGYAPEQD